MPKYDYVYIYWEQRETIRQVWIKVAGIMKLKASSPQLLNAACVVPSALSLGGMERIVLGLVPNLNGSRCEQFSPIDLVLS